MGERLFKRISYDTLNAKQKEVHNFHHIAAVLAKYGYATYAIRDDWNGGDMIARHMTEFNQSPLTIQIKSRLTFDKRYQNKGLWIGFPHRDGDSPERIYVFPHDEVLMEYGQARANKGQPNIESTEAWIKDGRYSWDAPSKELLKILEPYRLEP